MNTQKLKYSKANRLPTSADFQAVFSQPIRSKSTYFTVLARPNKEGGCARLGVIVAKRIIKRAVRRNAIRRLIRESFRVHQYQLNGLDVIVLVRCVLPLQRNQVFYECLKQQWQDLITQRQRVSFG